MGNLPSSSQPKPGENCRVCNRVLPDSLHCGHCGAVYGEARRCPHCRSITDVDGSGSLNQRCRVCGGLRIEVTDGQVVRSGREIPLLVRAQQAQSRFLVWRLASALVGFFGLFSLALTGLVLLFLQPSLIASLVALMMALSPMLVAWFSWRRATRHRTQKDKALDEAWLLTASDVIRHHGEGLRPDELAGLLGVEQSVAESLLTRLNVEDFIHARVTDDGELVYSMLDTTGVRIADTSDEWMENELETRDESARSKLRQ